jgi:hypothetical protein
MDGGFGSAFVPECRAVRDRTERLQDEPEAMPPAPVYPEYVSGRSSCQPMGYESVALTNRDFSRRAGGELPGYCSRCQ